MMERTINTTIDSQTVSNGVTFMLSAKTDMLNDKGNVRKKTSTYVRNITAYDKHIVHPCK